HGSAVVRRVARPERLRKKAKRAVVTCHNFDTYVARDQKDIERAALREGSAALSCSGIGLVLEFSAVVLEDPADDGAPDREEADRGHPPADRNAHSGERHCHGDEQRPPAVRAEEAVLAGPLLDRKSTRLN